MEFPRKPFHPIDPKYNPLEFQITDIFVPEADKNKERDNDELYTMLIYGTCINGATVCTKVDNFTLFYYIKPPESWENLSDEIFEKNVEEFKDTLLNSYYKSRTKNGNEYNRKIIPNNISKHFKNVQTVKKKDFWGFTNNKVFRFMKISVKSLQLFNSLKYYFQSLEKQGFKLYESNIDPFLKYIHIQDIKPCGWVRIEKYKIGDDISRCDYNIEVNHNHIIPIEVNKIAPLLITSFDIECSSSHGDFPLAKKNYSKVAQDLAIVAKAGYEYDSEFIINWLQNIFIDDVIIDEETNLKINRVYPRKKITNDFISSVPKLVESVIEEIISILDKIANSLSNDIHDDEDDEHFSKLSIRELNDEEDKITKLLSNVLPALEGDKIIQIGTTVHMYGSDKIVYKNIITLNTCDVFDGCDVVACKTEKEVLIKWKELMNNLNSDIVIGYNIFGFDMEYIWVRANELGIIDEFSLGLGRLIERKCSLVEQKLASSAMGENFLKYLDMDGTVLIDLLKIMQREQKLDSYKLDNVASIFLGDKKDDLKPNEIFEKFGGTSADRCVIAKYCIQDCCLVNRLMHKLKILENNIGMGNVCLVPLNYLFRRGQGIKIFSLIAKQCMNRDSLIPAIKSYRDNIEDDDGYEGAVVLEPKEGIYLNEPIVVFDYGSLYPSSMIARNLSHDTYIIDKKYMIDDPNIEYMKVCYDIYEGVGDKKKKTGVKECIFAQYKDGKKGIIPEILTMLLQERNNTKKKIEYKTAILKNGEEVFGIQKDKGNSIEYHNIDANNTVIVNKNDIYSVKDTYNNFEKDVFDSLQLAYKITANSLYGQIGARTSSIYLKDIAASTTATGREMIMIAKDFVETKYNAEVIYGDSVMPYTPITYLLDNKIMVNTFENIQGEWIDYKQFKPNDKDRFDKEQYIVSNINMKVWTHNGWSKITRIIRHKTVKKIYRILTNTGLVDVTEDHSLLNKYGEIIKPSNCTLGKELLHSQPILTDYSFNQLDIDQAFIYGAFMRNGECFKGEKWIIYNTDYDLLLKCKDIIESIEKIPFIIVNSSHYSDIYKLIPLTKNKVIINDLINKYKVNCYLNDNKIVPQIVINSHNIIVLEEFLHGLCGMNGNIKGFDKWFDIEHQITTQSLCILLQKIGYNVTISVLNDTNIYRLAYTRSKPYNSIAIKKITVLHKAYDGYVYDIETEYGVFHAGIGNMILKNTDSIFCKFPLTDSCGNTVYGKDALPYAIDIGKHVEKNIVQIMPKPQKLNYEKSLYPFILFSKKRYVGNLYETDINKPKQKSMGIVLKRRDNAQIVKKIYGGIIDIILNKQDLKGSIEFLQEELEDLVNGKTPITELVISKSLRASYKDPSKIAHKVLADRIGARDPGNRPVVNDRIPFVYIKTANPNALQGDRIENPDYILQNNLTPDYLHYITNQIMKPILQLYALCLDQLPGYDKDDSYWIDVEKSLLEKPMYTDDTRRKSRIENLRLNMVKELLFDKFINILAEPKIKKKREQRREPVKKHVKDTKEGLKEVKAEETNETDGVATVFIKVTKVQKTGKISSSAYILKNGKKIWNHSNDNGKTKEDEIESIIHSMIASQKASKYLINLNYVQFIKEFNMCIAKYDELKKNQDAHLLENTFQSQDIGQMKNMAIINKYKSLLDIKDKFQFEIKK